MMDRELFNFRCDLKDGYTIEEALQRNNLTFKYVLENMPRPYNRKPKKPGRKRKR